VDQALGKACVDHRCEQDGTTTPMEAAEVMNRFFGDKVDDLRKKALCPQVSEDAPEVLQEVGIVPQEVNNVRQEPANNNVTSGRHIPNFFFKFANAKKIAKKIKGLNNTEALWVDNIPTSVLKKEVEVLAGPVSHLINRSLAEGKVPAQFKIGRVHPIHKGKGKPREDPASYRPVSILPALSKVKETQVKENLEDHLRKVNGLPGSQYGFRPKRSCTSALAHAQAGWMSGAAKGQVVGLVAFDLSAAFDTGAAEQLSLTLQALGVTGRELRWFLCYMTGGRQNVVWDGRVSSLNNVLYGVRLGRSSDPCSSLSSSAAWPSSSASRRGKHCVRGRLQRLADEEQRRGGGQEAHGEGGPLHGVHKEHGPLHERSQDTAAPLDPCWQRV
jgi:hypothetical protein